MTQNQILIVEDEATIAKVLTLYCEQEGFQVKHLSNGNDVVDYIKNNSIDVMLLDLMLPGIDGITLCREIRQFSEMAIIIITAKSEVADRLLGLELEADDYICKPFSPREVIARVKAVLRRINTTSNGVIKYAGFTLNPHSFELWLESTLVELTPSEFKIFELLLSNTNRVFTRDEILNCAYNDTTILTDRNIDTHIKNIRKKVKEVDPSKKPIISIYGVGYKFTE